MTYQILFGFLLGLLLITSFLSLKFYLKSVLWQMHFDLENWISYGIGDDIRLKNHRPEFEYYVEKSKHSLLGSLNLPAFTVGEIRADIRSGKVRPIYYRVLWAQIKKLFR